ncbi:lipoprotein [Bacillus freudenreichii]|nr:lipoprotein [Bacillus freudenreichii]
MKKILIFIFGIAIVVGGAILLSPNDEKAYSNQSDRNNTQVETKETAEPIISPIVEEYSLSEEARERIATELGEIEDKEFLASNIMAMALQKVKLHENKNFEIAGTIIRHRPQITRENIAFLSEKSRTIDSDPVLVEILNKWSQENFTDIDKDFMAAKKF